MFRKMLMKKCLIMTLSLLIVFVFWFLNFQKLYHNINLLIFCIVNCSFSFLLSKYLTGFVYLFVVVFLALTGVETRHVETRHALSLHYSYLSASTGLILDARQLCQPSSEL